MQGGNGVEMKEEFLEDNSSPGKTLLAILLC
jgi:hypothetical protein